MKTSLHSVACLIFLSSLAATAQEAMSRDDRRSLTIVETEAPVFPLRLQGSAIMNGSAEVAVDVDRDGNLVDWLVTGYSRKEFADAAVAALKKWKYLPPVLEGRPRAAVRQLSFDFTRSGVVVNFSVMDLINSRLDEMTQDRHAYRTHTLRELDRIPTPVTVVSPGTLGNGTNQGTVTVEFFIDEEGHVRLPAVARADAGNELAAAALDAVRQWRFAPPTVKEQPVLVVAAQRFNFVPKD